MTMTETHLVTRQKKLDTESGTRLGTTKGRFYYPRIQGQSTDIGNGAAGTNSELVKAANQIGLGDKFYYEADYHVLICKTHGLGVVGLEKHLKDKHGLLKKEHQPILERYAGLAITKPQDVALPLMSGPPFNALREPAPGF
jgi:hypothetical protein